MNRYTVQISNALVAIVEADWAEEKEGRVKFYKDDQAYGHELVASFNKYDHFVKTGDAK